MPEKSLNIYEFFMCQTEEKPRKKGVEDGMKYWRKQLPSKISN